ncbi:MAG TPA: hypothetical protein PKA96_02780, partial [Candidatus Paceibacterota bacterium]|nr:hypothetical protein [Candidatus Paceibacterota bacterium]
MNKKIYLITKFSTIFLIISILLFGNMFIFNENAEIKYLHAQMVTGHPGNPSSPVNDPNNQSQSGSSTFLWKPESENDGKLVVLLPSSLRGDINKVCIKNINLEVIECGRFTGDTANGRRPHYRFSKPGAGYGGPILLVAELKNGQTRTWSIRNGAMRVEYDRNGNMKETNVSGVQEVGTTNDENPADLFDILTEAGKACVAQFFA